MIKAIFPALATIALFVAPAFAADTTSIEIPQVWARATSSSAKTGAAYLTMVNKGGVEDRLVAAGSPAADKVELHTNIDDHGVMRMRPVAAIPVKAGETVTLQPGGYHIMLVGLKKPLARDTTFPLTLTFEKAGTLSVTVHVASAGAGGPEAGGMNMKMSPDHKM